MKPCSHEIGCPRIVAGVLILLGLFARIALITGPLGSDDANYFHFAEKLLRWQPFGELQHQGGRLAFLALIGMPAVELGSIRAGAMVNILILSIRDIGIVWYVRARLGWWAALSAAGVLGFNALTVTYAGQMLPDGLLSLAMFAASALVFEAVQRPRPSGRAWFLAGAGVMAGVAYSTKDTGILVLPCAITWIAVAGWRQQGFASAGQVLQGTAVFLAGFASVALLEMGIHHVLNGDAFYRYHALAWTHNTVGDVSEAASLYDFARHAYWNALGVTAWDRASLPVLVLAAAMWSTCMVKRLPLSYFAMVGAFLAIYLIFGSSSLTRLIPLPVQDRYFEVLVPFLAVSTGEVVSFLCRAWPGWRARFAMVGLPALLALASVPSVVMNAGAFPLRDVGINAASAIAMASGQGHGRFIYLSEPLYRIVKSFVPPATYSLLEVIPEAGPLPSGYYLYSPFVDAYSRQGPTREDIKALPRYSVISGDHRLFRRLLKTSQDGEVVMIYKD